MMILIVSLSITLINRLIVFCIDCSTDTTVAPLASMRSRSHDDRNGNATLTTISVLLHDSPSDLTTGEKIMSTLMLDSCFE